MKKPYVEFTVWAAIIVAVTLLGHWAFSVDTHAQESGGPTPTVTPTSLLDEGGDEEDEKREELPDCSDPGYAGYPECWTATPRPTATNTPRPRPTATDTPLPTLTPTPVTGPPIPFVPTEVPCPPGWTRGPCYAPGGTWTPTNTPIPTSTAVGQPTDTPTPTSEDDEDGGTGPTPTDTPTSGPTPTPTPTPKPESTEGVALQQRKGRRVAKGGDGSGRIQGRWVRWRPFGSRVETLWPFADVGRARWRGEDAARDTGGPGVTRVCGAVG